MKIKNLVGNRFKERPSDCVVDSHALMVRGGYIKNVANGIFSLYPPAKREKIPLATFLMYPPLTISAWLSTTQSDGRS